MRWQKRLICKIVSFLLVSSTSTAALEQGQPYQEWWKRHKEGWYFYNEKFPPPEPQQEVEPARQPESPPETAKQPDKQEETKELFVDMMQKKGKELLSKAIENPTVENLRAYMEFNKLQMQISSNFALAWARVLAMYPDLAVNIPNQDADKAIYFAEQDKEVNNTIRKLADFAGLFFFYSTTCPYCQRQAVYLTEFRKKHPEMVIKPITIDGGVLPEFPDTVMDNGISQTLGVTTVPALFLAYPPDQFDRIATGIISTSDLEKVLVQYYQYYTTLATGQHPFLR